MKLIIAGSRNYPADAAIIDRAMSLSPYRKSDISEVVSGGAAGIDWAGEEWAKREGIKLHVINANWDFYGKLAGPKRNEEMAKYVGDDGALLAIMHEGSRGTKNMIETARKYGLPVFVYRPDQDPDLLDHWEP